MREVIQLQFGAYASFVGCHMYNLEQEVARAVPDRDQDHRMTDLAARAAATDAEAPPEPSDEAGREVDARVLFREARDPRSGGARVRVPRMVAFGGRGSLGSVPEGGTLAADDAPVLGYGGGGGGGGGGAGGYADLSAVDGSNPALSWQGDVSVQQATPLARSPFLRTLEERRVRRAERRTDRAAERRAARDRDLAYAGLDGNVSFWTDFMRFHLHPRNVFEMPGHTHGVTPFDYFNEGASLVASSVGLRDDMADSVRLMAEECDSMQGFQVLVDADTGWSGVCARFLEDLRDDYNYAPFLVAGVSPFRDPAATLSAELARDSVNRALFQCAVAPLAGLYMPLSAAALPGRVPLLDASQRYHTSAVLAAALHSATRPYRASSLFTTMHGYAASLTPVAAARTVALGAMLPVSDGLAGEIDGMVGVAADERTREGGLARRPRRGPLFRAPGMLRLSPALVPEAAAPGERVIAEWAVVCGSRKLATPRIDEHLRESRAQCVPPPGVEAGAVERGDFSGRCWEPFLRRMASTPAEHREATYAHNPMPVPVQFPPFLERHEGEEVDGGDGAGERGRGGEEAKRQEDAFGGGGGDDEDAPVRRTSEVTVLANAFSASSMHLALAAQADSLRRCSRVQTLRGQFDKHGLQEDDWNEAVHDLENMAEAYRHD